MTLINLQSRIHFANDVLEEALMGELEECGARHILILSEDRHSADEFGARVLAGLPLRIAATCLAIAPDETKHQVWDRAAHSIDAGLCDTILAYGSARAIAYGRKCRVEIAKLKYATVPPRARGARRERALLPDYLVIPGVDGLPNPCCDRAGQRAAFRGAPPSVIICDPAVTQDAAPQDCASAYANTLGRCLEALGHQAFNPIADGFATEGLRRLVLAKPALDQGDLSREVRLNLMAAALSGALAQQKGPGLLLAVYTTLCETTERELDAGAVARALLPPGAQDILPSPRSRGGLVHQIFGFDRDRPLGPCLLDLMGGGSLKGLALGATDLRRARTALAEDSRWQLPNQDRLAALLDAAY